MLHKTRPPNEIFYRLKAALVKQAKQHGAEMARVKQQHAKSHIQEARHDAQLCGAATTIQVAAYACLPERKFPGNEAKAGTLEEELAFVHHHSIAPSQP